MIEQFQGEYRWLSNFWYFEKPLEYLGLYYPTNEHFYVAMKTTDKEIRKLVAEHPLKGIKGYGKKIQVREDWGDIKLKVVWVEMEV